jgi:hypothetical protein
MAYKQKSKGELFGINEELSEWGRPVFEKDLGSDVMAEANRDGTTFIDAKLSSKEKAEAIEHENVHHEQIAQGRLSYNNDEVMWKKDTRSPARVYKREGGSLSTPGKKSTEGDKDFEWEKEAYNK